MNAQPTTPRRSRNSHKSHNSRKSRKSPRTPTTPTPRTPTGNISGAVANDTFPETTEVLSSLAENPEKCDWWVSFAIKITNLINLLETYKELFNYVITGSSAVALLAYFTNKVALSTLEAPNDGDIIIIPVDQHERSFRNINNKIGLFKIGNYVIDEQQQDTKSATFDKLEITKNTTTFDSIDVNIEDNIKYITLDDNIKILSPQTLVIQYTDNFRNQNIHKHRFLSSRNSSNNTVFIFTSVNTRNKAQQSKKSRLNNSTNGRKNGNTNGRNNGNTNGRNNGNGRKNGTRTVLQF
jgi:hypothetical protein